VAASSPAGTRRPGCPRRDGRRAVRRGARRRHRRARAGGSEPHARRPPDHAGSRASRSSTRPSRTRRPALARAVRRPRPCGRATSGRPTPWRPSRIHNRHSRRPRRDRVARAGVGAVTPPRRRRRQRRRAPSTCSSGPARCSACGA
jgi:hypothetical protein